ncbi:MAG: primase DnaG/twinkle, TOPRIM domain [Caudoviricetes sp.]|nr:MAG: primase DnaG/twinkle, TOPRIM domain [Caudoviricetes sp.]
MRTVEAVIGKWDRILEHYGLPPITGKHHFKGECPICKAKGKFRIDDQKGQGTYICTCSSGTGWTLLEKTQGKDFKTLAREIDSILGNTYRGADQPRNTTKTEDIRKKVLNKFSKLKALNGTNASLYLKNRGVDINQVNNVRFCEAEKTPDGVFGVIYSLATDATGNFCYLHRTFLDGSKKADILTNKKMNSLQEDSYLEHAQSVAIRLSEVSSTLGIAEGIETALSCNQIYKCNTWATLNASLMKKFLAPKGVRHLIIFADTDSNLTGHAAAFECGRKNLLSNNDVERVSIRWPQKGDFNDVIKGYIEVYEWVGIR